MKRKFPYEKLFVFFAAMFVLWLLFGGVEHLNKSTEDCPGWSPRCTPDGAQAEDVIP